MTIDYTLDNTLYVEDITGVECQITQLNLITVWQYIHRQSSYSVLFSLNSVWLYVVRSQMHVLGSGFTSSILALLED